MASTSSSLASTTAQPRVRQAGPRGSRQASFQSCRSESRWARGCGRPCGPTQPRTAHGRAGTPHSPRRSSIADTRRRGTVDRPRRDDPALGQLPHDVGPGSLVGGGLGHEVAPFGLAGVAGAVRTLLGECRHDHAATSPRPNPGRLSIRRGFGSAPACCHSRGAGPQAMVPWAAANTLSRSTRLHRNVQATVRTACSSESSNVSRSAECWALMKAARPGGAHLRRCRPALSRH